MNEISHLGLDQPSFWLQVLEIIGVNILLSGDNAVVIAMACRNLSPRARNWGIALGSAVAVVLLILFTGIVATILTWPWLKLVGGVALLYISIDLLHTNEDEDKDIKASDKLLHAVVTVVIADIVMSLDNVIAVAAAANGSLPLLVFGLASSIPLIIAGAALIMALLSMLPILIWAGSALLGWIAGDVIATDPAVYPRLQELFEGAMGVELDALLTLLGVAPLFVGGIGGELVCAALGVVVVLIAGAIWRRQSLHFAAQRTRETSA